DPEGVVKILDMGIASVDPSRLATGGGQVEQLTQTNQPIGTPDFMSPEQAENSKLADARSDIYSLGCALYRLLTGRSLFEGDNPIEVILAHIRRPPPSLRESRPGAPEELEAIVLRMLAKEPGERFQTMKELSEALIACPLPDEESGGIVVNANPSLRESDTHRLMVSPSSSDLPDAKQRDSQGGLKVKLGDGDVPTDEITRAVTNVEQGTSPSLQLHLNQDESSDDMPTVHSARLPDPGSADPGSADLGSVESGPSDSRLEELVADDESSQSFRAAAKPLADWASTQASQIGDKARTGVSTSATKVQGWWGVASAWIKERDFPDKAARAWAWSLECAGIIGSGAKQGFGMMAEKYRQSAKEAARLAEERNVAWLTEQRVHWIAAGTSIASAMLLAVGLSFALGGSASPDPLSPSDSPSSDLAQASGDSSNPPTKRRPRDLLQQVGKSVQGGPIGSPQKKTKRKPRSVVGDSGKSRGVPRPKQALASLSATSAAAFSPSGRLNDLTEGKSR
ncbi:MAG: hypothetical protein N2C14_29470, partial [Planctomycetales bacterium]